MPRLRLPNTAEKTPQRDKGLKTSQSGNMEEVWCLWRYVGRQREPVGCIDDRKSAVRHVEKQQPGNGRITSHRAPTKQELEFVAWQHKVTIEQAKKLIELGAVRWQIR